MSNLNKLMPPMHIYKWVPRRLWQQIFFILLGLMIVPLVILGTLLIHTSQKTIEETVSRDLKQIALHATGEVLNEYEGAFRALEATASILGTLHADAWRQETAVVALSLKYPSLRRICSVNSKGRPVACSDLAASQVKELNADVPGLWRGENRWVSKVRTASDHVPVMDMSVPVRRYGKVEGLLTAEYSLRGVWDVVDQIQFGPQSRAILVDQYGRILAHPDKKEVLKNNTFTYPEVLGDLELGRNAARTVLDARKQKWIVAYSPITSLGWGLILAQPYREAFAFVRLMHYHSWILVVFSVLAAALIGFIIAQWMSRPMHEMIEATRRLAKGDLSVSLPIHRRDEIGRLKFAFNHMTVQLKKARQMERLSIVGKSAASIAHELKNSLVLVKAFVQLMPQRHKDKAFVQDATKTIAKELDGWNEMLRNMMDFAREQMPLDFAPVNLNALIEEVVFLAKLKVEKRGVHFHVQTSDAAPLVWADEGKIKQVIVNLIANAVEAAPIGGEIWVRNTTAGFEVANSGEGIAAEHLARIFDPFFTTRDTGLGLGLAICRDIVHKHGGRIEVSSEIGKGAAFRVFLPVYTREHLGKGVG
ncbi:MAG: HAMP domain-containing protein [Candidatus Omnitrophica bacterium]|nr:HAMP domain-containing protein [Candidatus Omnitrophota bacterium]